jgi:hypothetical protein
VGATGRGFPPPFVCDGANILGKRFLNCSVNKREKLGIIFLIILSRKVVLCIGC